MRALSFVGIAVLAGVVLFASSCLPSRPHPLTEKPAPAFFAETVDGTEVSLTKHKGQDIVVLDFWASWCPPCREGLPAVAELTQAYRGQPVAVYAVNQGEDAATAMDYLQSEGLDLAVILDEETNLGALYGVSGIPQTVIIDKDGRIAEVHVGYRRGDERRWRRTIDALLSK